MTDQHTFDQHLNTYTRLRTWMYSRNNILSLLDESAKFWVVAVVEINLNLWWSIGRWRRVRACRNLEALRTTVVYRWRLPCASHARQEPSHHHRPRHRRFWQIFSTVFFSRSLKHHLRQFNFSSVFCSVSSCILWSKFWPFQYPCKKWGKLQ